MELPTPMDMRCCGSALEWWSVQSDLSIWPTAAQVEKEICIVSCRIVVLNASIYQRVASISTTSTANFPHMPTNYTRNFQVSTSGKGKISHHKLFQNLVYDVISGYRGFEKRKGFSTSGIFPLRSLPLRRIHRSTRISVSYTIFS